VALALWLLSGQGLARELLTYQALMRGSFPRAVDLSAFTPDPSARPASHTFEGVLQLSGTPATRTIHTDPAFVDARDLALARTLPQDFAFEFIQENGEIIPVRRGPQPSAHGEWEFVLEPGRVWDEPADHGFSRAVIPFALQEKNANCLHNGLLMFLFRNDGTVSHAALQISGETCSYLKFDMWAALTAGYAPGSVAAHAATLAVHRAEVAHRLPVRSLAQLAQDYPAVNVAGLAIGAARARTVYGLVVKGVNYASACATRSGDYPYCEVLDLPSYSTAKSAFAAVALMRLQALTQDARTQPVRKWVAASACQGPAWEGVTFQDVLDMATGNYDSALYEEDENDAKTRGLFLPLEHAGKIAFACGAYPRRSPPGTVWVYHTSDTYLLGTALNGYLRSLPGRSDADVFEDIVVADVFRPLGLSPVTDTSRRTYDAVREPFAGWGLTYHYDDIARLAIFLNAGDGRIGAAVVLDPQMLATALQRDPADRGLPAANLSNFRYKYGFWARNVQALLGCAQPTWVPFMSGFGGISVVLFPNGIVYYNFSDDGELASFDWGSPARQVQKIRDYCR
jgi:hypothetical protein